MSLQNKSFISHIEFKQNGHNFSCPVLTPPPSGGHTTETVPPENKSRCFAADISVTAELYRKNCIDRKYWKNLWEIHGSFDHMAYMAYML